MRERAGLLMLRISPISNIPYLPSLLVLVPCLSLEAPSCSSLDPPGPQRDLLLTRNSMFHCHIHDLLIFDVPTTQAPVCFRPHLRIHRPCVLSHAHQSAANLPVFCCSAFSLIFAYTTQPGALQWSHPKEASGNEGARANGHVHQLAPCSSRSTVARPSFVTRSFKARAL